MKDEFRFQDHSTGILYKHIHQRNSVDQWLEQDGTYILTKSKAIFQGSISEYPVLLSFVFFYFSV